MNELTFINNAVKTEKVVIPTQRPINQELLLKVLNMFISAGNILDMVKKSYYYNKTITPEKLINLIDNLTKDLTNLKDIASDVILDKDLILTKDLNKEFDLLEGNDFLHINTRIMHSQLGIATEGVELVENLVKSITESEYDITNLKEELGDIEWYKAIMYDEAALVGANGFNDDNIREMVIEKLKARYGDKFKEDSANNRDLKKERTVLDNY